MNQNIDQTYQNLADKYQLKVDDYKTKNTRNAIYRGITFLVGATLIYVLARFHWSLPVASFLIAGYIFVWLVQHSAHINRQLEYFKHLVGINTKEKKVLTWKYNEFNNGESYLNPEDFHQYDLDLFGEGSVFQYLNRTCTTGGEDRLATFLSNPELNEKEIISRQLATVELMPLLDWRQAFQATGLIEHEEKQDRSRINHWLNQQAFFSNKAILKGLVFLIPLISIGMLVLLILGFITGSIFLIYLMIPLGVIGTYLKQINKEQKQVSQTWHLLKKYAALLELIENADFKSQRLGIFQYELRNEEAVASKKVEELSKIIKGLDNRNNMLVGIILNALLLWDLHFMFKLENWRKENKSSFNRWAEILSEFDAFSSLGNYAYNNPLYIFPDIDPKTVGLKIVDSGHPLLPEQQRVNNDFRITEEPSFIIITGANMAGKSTFLRTIGTNMMLGMAGAPVCAKQFSFAPTEVYTSMRTTDSLQKNESYFFAELSRLKKMIDKLKSGTKLFIILDEVLKGTNSRDKALGSKALVKQLIHMNTTGIIATHDVSLGSLIEEFPKNVLNCRFEVEMENDELVFDYKIKDGISQNLNATFLMRKMGITVDDHL